MKTLTSLFLCLILLSFGCKHFNNHIDNESPKFYVGWAYETGKIVFIIYNSSKEDVLVEFPLSEKYDTAKILYYRIDNNDADNFQETQTRCYCPSFREDDYRIIYTAGDGPRVQGDLGYIFAVPSLTKKFEDIRSVELRIAAVPISQLSTVNSVSSFKELFRKNKQTYIVDFTLIGYKEKKGTMELQNDSK